MLQTINRRKRDKRVEPEGEHTLRYVFGTRLIHSFNCPPNVTTKLNLKELKGHFHGNFCYNLGRLEVSISSIEPIVLVARRGGFQIISCREKELFLF